MCRFFIRFVLLGDIPAVIFGGGERYLISVPAQRIRQIMDTEGFTGRDYILVRCRTYERSCFSFSTFWNLQKLDGKQFKARPHHVHLHPGFFLRGSSRFETTAYGFVSWCVVTQIPINITFYKVRWTLKWHRFIRYDLRAVWLMANCRYRIADLLPSSQMISRSMQTHDSTEQLSLTFDLFEGRQGRENLSCFSQPRHLTSALSLLWFWKVGCGCDRQECECEYRPPTQSLQHGWYKSNRLK